MRSARILGVALLVLAVSFPVGARDEGATPPLLEAVAYVRPEAELFGQDVVFTDWAELKRLHGAAAITSDSPLGDRQRFLLDVARSEAISTPLGLDRLEDWKDAWGWDNTDLAWETRIGHSDAVLRFRDDWDAEGFRAALDARGYSASGIAGGTRHAPGSEDGVVGPVDLALERVIGEIDTFDDDSYESRAPIDISDDGRTVIVRYGGGAGELVRRTQGGARRLASSSRGRVALALGTPVSASIKGGWICPVDAYMAEVLIPEAEPLLRSVAPLHEYEAVGTGYSRSEPGAEPTGRIVFAYPEPSQAAEDLEGRRRLIEEGYPWPDSPGTGRYGDMAFSLVDAQVSGSELIIDVDPLDGVPANLAKGMGRGANHLMCGPIPD